MTQLFVTDCDPTLCAVVLDDYRLRKALNQTALLICTAAHQRGYPSIVHPYKPTAAWHPLTKWVASSRRSFWWTVRHHQALASEYFHRFGETPEDYARIGKQLWPPDIKFPASFLNRARNKEVDFSDYDDVFEAYRLYLAERWANTSPIWSRRSHPYFVCVDLSFDETRDRLPYQHPLGVLSARARAVVRFPLKGESGTVECPECGGTIVWRVPYKDNYVELQCKQCPIIWLDVPWEFRNERYAKITPASSSQSP